MIKPTIAEIANKFNVPEANIARQFVKNAAHIRKVIAALEGGDSRVSNYTAKDLPMLREAADNYETKAKACAS